MLKVKYKKAQSTLEYIVVLTAVVAVIIYAATTFIKPAVQNSIGDAESGIGAAADKLSTIAPGPTTTTTAPGSTTTTTGI